MQENPSPHEGRAEESPELSPLAARLLRRRAASLGLIDVKHAARHHERLAHWLDEHFPLLGYLRTRYAEADARPGEQTLLFQQWSGRAEHPAGLAPAVSPADSLPRFPPSVPAAPQTPATPPAAPPQQLRVSRVSAARAMRHGRKTGAAAPSPAATSSTTPAAGPEGKQGELPRAVELTASPRRASAETPVAARGHAGDETTGAGPRDTPTPAAPRTLTQAGSERLVESDPGRPRRVETRAHGEDATARAGAGAGGAPASPGGEVAAARVTPARGSGVRVRELSPELSPRALPLPGRRVADELPDEAAAPAVPPSPSATDMPLPPAAPGRQPPPDATRHADRAEAATGGSGISLAGRKNVAAAVVSAEARVGASEGPPEIIWRAGGGQAAADGTGPARTAATAPPSPARAAPEASPESPGRVPSAEAGAASPPPRRPEVDIDRLTESVMRAISRRLSVERERRGGGP